MADLAVVGRAVVVPALLRVPPALLHLRDALLGELLEVRLVGQKRRVRRQGNADARQDERKEPAHGPNDTLCAWRRLRRTTSSGSRSGRGEAVRPPLLVGAERDQPAPRRGRGGPLLLGLRRQALPRLRLAARQRLDRAPAPEARRRDQGAGGQARARSARRWRPSRARRRRVSSPRSRRATCR